MSFFFFFFFQAEDGIRDLYVTGVQTCALPIYRDALFVVAVLIAEHLDQVALLEPDADQDVAGGQDRKSTRLNSSHVEISYAVFCLKKKKKKKHRSADSKKDYEISLYILIMDNA